MAFLAKLRPLGPWRASSSTGERSRAGAILHNDALYSALTQAMAQLGVLDSWITATAANPQGSAVRLSSVFPFLDQLLFVTPPRTLWPPPPSLKVRWKSARLVPTTMVSLLLNNRKIREDDWTVDGASECLLPVFRGQAVSSPFRPSVRTAAAVDRLGEGVEPYRTACIEFHRSAGVWCAFDFADESAAECWKPALQGALKLLADTGLGGERSRGWGRFEQPEFSEGPLAQLLFGKYAPPAPAQAGAWWLLSQFSPSPEHDRVDWKQGSYEIALRNGRVESSAGWGALKQSSKMVVEGSVLAAGGPLTGVAHDVAPEGFAHPVYRAGFALALPVAGAKKVETVIEESTIPEPVAEPEEAQPAPTETAEALAELEEATTETKQQPEETGDGDV
jgi:CRISPR/Cas system CSM-associated protein Csm4 (group 5 of RAMP superfamily)